MSELHIYTVHELLELFTQSEPPANFEEFGIFGSAECIAPLEEDKYLNENKHQKRTGTELPIDNDNEKRQTQPQPHYQKNRQFQNQNQQNQNQQQKKQVGGPKKFTSTTSTVKVEKGFDDMQFNWGAPKKESLPSPTPSQAPAPTPASAPAETKPEIKPSLVQAPLPKTQWSQVNTGIPTFSPQPAKEDRPALPTFEPVRKQHNNFNPQNINKFTPYYNNNTTQAPAAPSFNPQPATTPTTTPSFNPRPAAHHEQPTVAEEKPAQQEKKEASQTNDSEFPSFSDLEPKKTQKKAQPTSQPQKQRVVVDDEEYPSLTSSKPISNQKRSNAWGKI
ncbi:proline-rich extensin signature family [Trichomonas vaginalis G3]|uniref:proline-rich extensin signature family n=1 Tax=Trichomonas vaginalis (strain ATCC PRA-98 / G3) TaxID=412133 RepID=UPI0021E59F30|nr:proline-rich extensin signature family [Trichomonas vaginalis G3]KAI5488308.1 proline-rich extensin signature family [Trichomonas vaginalis G3]